MMMIDTCFLIDYQRESARTDKGAVAAFLRAHAEERLQISTYYQCANTRITLDLNDKVVQRVRRKAADEHKSLEEVINQALTH